MSLQTTRDHKQAVRKHIWELLEREGAARFPGARGRIPNFDGAARAAEQLARTTEWAEARVVKANPDAPQLPVRALALGESKVLYMAVPRLRDPKPFLLLDPAKIKANPRKTVSIRGASQLGKPVATSAMRRVDLVVCGSVAVNREGARVGKGGGSATVFGVVDEAVSNTAQAAPRTELIRFDIEMIETTEGWKVNRVNILQSPGQSPFP